MNGWPLGTAWLIVLAVLVLPAAAQEHPSPEHLGAYRDTLDVTLPQPFVLRSYLLPGSETIYANGSTLDSTTYRIDPRFGRLWVDTPVLDTTTTLVAVYRTWGGGLQETYRRRRVERIPVEADSTGAVAVIEERGQDQEDGFDPFGGVQLQRSGSITRGILAGNNRDATIESGLQMQVAGEIAEEVHVQAVLTDQNTPILPEGNTQRLSEFDRVFIEIQAPQGTAQLGDFDLALQQSEFARFTRKLQGITLFGDLPAAGSVLAGGHVAVAGATSRGIFRTQDIDIIDGVQGPYRLVGQNGERFIIVIPGSEAVYVDGQRQTRGETNDYVIDYATGELTFTSNRLITQDKRVTVEFQYRTNEFTRTIVASEADVGFWPRSDGQARGRIGVTFLREADSQQFSEEFGLTAEDDDVLEAVGDSTARRSGAVRVEFDPEAPYVQYTQRDTVLADGTIDTMYVALQQAPMDGEPVYRVQFSSVGQGNGRYAREGRVVNGILYVYRGLGGGEYEPIRILPKPKQQRLLDLRGAFQPIPGLELFGEFARSLNDQNRISALDAGDDLGDAYVSGVRLRPLPIMFGETDLGTVSFEVRRRFTGDHFAAFDRTHPVEFARRWNLDTRGVRLGGGVVQEGDEAIDEGEARWAVTSRSTLGGEIGRIRLEDTFEGSRRAILLQAAEPGWPRLAYRLEDISSRDARIEQEGDWLRQLGRIEVPLLQSKLTPELEIEHERRRQRVFGTDSLAAPSLAFIEYRPGVRWQSRGLELGGTLEYRTEDLWAAGILRGGSQAWTLQSGFKLQRKPRLFSTEGSIGYRVRRFSEYFRTEQQLENNESVVMSWNGTYRPLKQAVQVIWLYEALTERTPELQEIYIRTGPELGEYVWEDSNNDGVIQIDEFLPERTQDEGAYVQTFIPSDSLTSIISVQTRWTLSLDPSLLWQRPEARWQRWLSHIRTRTTLQVQEKSRDPELAQIYLLNLSRFRSSENTLRGLLRIGQDIYLFRNQPRYGLDLSFYQTRNLNELAAGEETRFINQWRVEGTFRPTEQWGIRVLSSLEQNRTDSEAFASRRYDIKSIAVEPEVSYRPFTAFGTSAGLAFAQKEDAIGGRSAQVWKAPVTADYTRAGRFGVNSRFEMAHVALKGEAVGLAEFQLTDGRGPGTSFLWTASGWLQLSRLLRATFSYTGRAPSDAPTLHTMSIKLSAVF